MATSRESTAPIADFHLPASTGQTLGLDAYKGKVPLALVFLDIGSDDDRALLLELNGRLKDFGDVRSQVLIIARLTAREAREMADTMELSIPILADASGAVAREFEAVANGSARRIAVVADKDGRERRRFDPLPVDDLPGVAEALLDAVRSLGHLEQ